MQSVKVERQFRGKTLSIEVGGVAKQADGAAIVRYGDTMVLVTVISAKGRDEMDFFPLFVDYREKSSAVGKFPGGFFKREGRPTTEEILTMRLVDRPVRPLFPDGYNDEVQIQAIVLSSDRQNKADVLTMIGTSACLCVSRIPFEGPIGAVRIGKVDGKLVAFPTYAETEQGKFDLVVAGKRGMLLMVEGFMDEVGEAEVIEALDFAQGVISELVDLQMELMEKVRIPEKVKPVPDDNGPALDKVRATAWGGIMAALRTGEKVARREAVDAVRKKTLETLLPAGPGSEQNEALSEKRLKAAFEELLKKATRKIIAGGDRLDGRGHKDVRPIDIEVGLLPRTHGSALFTRGETQALVVLTLGTIDDEQRIEGLTEEYKKKFLLHYNFPPFCVGEVRPIRGPGRREIGHGMLAERSLAAVIPPWERFPYTIRVESDILESNGSSSMATVCGSTLALMDGGVPIVRPIAGIAMGLIREDGQYHVLTDIMGAEDHNGDMDFKVAGTEKGVCGLQMDIKIDGIPREVLEKALIQAKEARLHVLGEMLKALDTPRTRLSPYAPKLVFMKVPPDKIGMIIGPGGKNINRIQTEYSVAIDIEDDGRLTISGDDPDKVERARLQVEGVVAEPELGKVYTGKVVSIKDFGAFIEFLPGQDGLCHISELGEGFVNRAEDVVREGDVVNVRLIGFDDRGKIKLSMRAAADPNWNPDSARPPAPRRPRQDSDRPPRGGRDSGRPPRGGGGEGHGDRGGRPPRGDRFE